MGQARCGKCYCLETQEKGCEIIDFRDIGDLSYAVGETVQFEGTRDVLCTEMCPCQIKLFKIKIGVLTDDGYRFVEASPTPAHFSSPSGAPASDTASPGPTPTATANFVRESACDSPKFDLAPDLEERMSPVVERDRIRGAIDSLSGAPGETTVHAGGDSYRLRGIDFDEAEHGRMVDLQGRLDEQDGRVFYVESYEFVPYAVLSGRLRVEELCKMKCDDWLLFDVEQGGQTYTFGLAWSRDKYPELWKLRGQQVALAGDLYSGRNWLGLYSFGVRYICENAF
jgi:hypothetical protein